MQIDTIKIRIMKELNYMGYDISLYGTQYLTEAIYIIINQNEIDTINLNKEIYPILSQKYKKSINNIRCAVQYATKMMYCRVSIKKMMEDFHFCEDTKPTIKQVIYVVLNKISYLNNES